MNLNYFYSFINFLAGGEQSPLILWSIMNISGFVSGSESTEFPFIWLSGLPHSGERFPNPNSIFNHSTMNKPPACRWWEMMTMMRTAVGWLPEPAVQGWGWVFWSAGASAQKVSNTNTHWIQPARRYSDITQTPELKTLTAGREDAKTSSITA